MDPMVKRLHRYTYSDYVALEQDSPTKHEFLDGEIYAMGELAVDEIYRASTIR
jgi:hypothetical protein